jgi:hypothetical protein
VAQEALDDSASGVARPAIYKGSPEPRIPKGLLGSAATVIEPRNQEQNRSKRL